jgi:hypothetical protein
MFLAMCYIYNRFFNRYIKLPDSWGGSSLFLFAEGSSELSFSLRPVITYLLYYYSIQNEDKITCSSISLIFYLILMSWASSLWTRTAHWISTS